MYVHVHIYTCTGDVCTRIQHPPAPRWTMVD